MTLNEPKPQPVLVSSVLITLAIVLIGGVYSQTADEVLSMIKSWLIDKSGWLYILSVAIFTIFCIGLMVSRLGDICLGPDDAQPEHSNLAWFSMLFAAGMAGSLLFFCVAEPIMHFLSPPIGEPMTPEAAAQAMQITFFHWGVHAWAIYAVVGLALGYFSYRHDLPLLPRSALYPLIGDRIYGYIGHCVDTFAVVGTVFGFATSIGFGAVQINAGLSHVFHFPNTMSLQIILIALFAICASISVLLGLDKGIKRLSKVNLGLALFLIIAVLAMGPTVLLLKSLMQNIGSYLSQFISETFNMYAYAPVEGWLGGWTLLYWAWWIAWAPFVGMFTARISKGRTIREFLAGILFVPAGFTFLWLTVFGNSALDFMMQNNQSPLGSLASSNLETALFAFFENFALPDMLSTLSLVLLVIFFVSSIDSGALVLNMLTSQPTEHKQPVARVKSVFWTFFVGALATVLLCVGGLQTLQTLMIASAFPFMLVMLLYCFCIFKQLREDHMLQACVQTHHTSVQFSKVDMSWQKRLQSLLHHPSLTDAQHFMDTMVVPALSQLSHQMQHQSLTTELVVESNQVLLLINKDNLEDFSYGIRLRPFVVPAYADEERDDYYRAEVFLSQGGQQYDVFGYSKEQLIADALTQYERHLHFLHLASAEVAPQEA